MFGNAQRPGPPPPPVPVGRQPPPQPTAPTAPTAPPNRQAREYLYWQLTGRQVTTPLAVMTSDAKGNHARITALLERSGWFGRSPDAFRLFRRAARGGGGWARRDTDPGSAVFGACERLAAAAAGPTSGPLRVRLLWGGPMRVRLVWLAPAPLLQSPPSPSPAAALQAAAGPGHRH
jgi:hypothetical protein